MKRKNNFVKFVVSVLISFWAVACLVENIAAKEKIYINDPENITIDTIDTDIQIERIIDIEKRKTVELSSQDSGKESTKNSQVTYYIYDRFGNVLCEYDESGNLIANYIYANGKRIAKVEGENTYYYHNNPSGSPLAITDASGNVVKEYNYYPFGEISQEGGTAVDAYKFTGKELDDETGLHYYGARFYDASIGRFITPDPSGKFEKGDPQTLNPYVYCTNNPLRYIDPNGAYRVEHGYAYPTSVGMIMGEQTVGLLPLVDLGLLVNRAVKGDYTITELDWTLAGINTASWALTFYSAAIGKGATTATKLGLAINSIRRLSKVVSGINWLVYMGCSEAYRDAVIWGIAERKGIEMGGTRGGGIRTTDSRFKDVVEFLEFLEKYDWDVDNLLKATTSKEDRRNYEEWGRWYEEEIKAEINW